jgi:hypothetical protein
MAAERKKMAAERKKNVPEGMEHFMALLTFLMPKRAYSYWVSWECLFVWWLYF